MKKNFYHILFIISLIFSTITSLYAQSWIGNEWNYRRLVTITNPGATELTDYQVRINLNNTFDFADANSDGSDIRITAADGITELPFWIETWNAAGTQATIWIKVPTLPTSGLTVCLYYGNASAPSIANGVNTFNAYDGFENYTPGSVPTSTITNPGEWERYAGNPLISPGTTGSWDALGATFASVIYDNRVGEYRMYYHGYNSSFHQVGLATSSDGINWTKYSGNPIVAVGTSGSWDATGVRVPMVWKEGTTDYRMIYTGAGTTSGQIGYATSTDGINWTKYAGNPVFNDPTWAHNQTENWGVMKVGNEYQMWYSTWGQRQSGIAVSTDLINWTPHTPGPIFTSNGITSDDRYSQFCPFSFTYGGLYYVLVPSYSSVGDYSKFYLYRSSSPYFPESDRTLVRIAHTPQGVDAKDNDTPYVLTSDIERSIFPNNELRVYYAGDPGSGNWFECLLIEPDIAVALSEAPLPSAGNLSWTSAGTVAVVNSPVHQGTQSVRLTNSSSLTGNFAQLTQGVVGAWMRRSSTNLLNDFDIYLYDVSGTTINSLNCIAGLGRENTAGQGGRFHYYTTVGTTPAFVPTTTNWVMDTWYFVTCAFDCNTNLYDFVVYNELMQEVLRVDNIAFAHPANSTAINRGMLYTGGTFAGNAFADDYRVYRWPGVDITSSVGAEEPNPFPVELSSFSVSIIGSSVKLSWRTETEVNNYGFEVERQVRSSQSSVGNYEKIGFVNGNGNSNSPKNYSFTDLNPITGSKFYYRLKQIDNDGQFEYSNAVEIELVPTEYALYQNYPNPFNPSTMIRYQLPNESKVVIKIYNILGSEVMELVNERKEAGIYEVEFDTDNLSSGTYIYRIIAGSYIETKKMLLLK